MGKGACIDAGMSLAKVLDSGIEQVGMSIHVALHHRTTYQYDKPVALGPQWFGCVRRRIRALSAVLFAHGQAKQHFINWQQTQATTWHAWSFRRRRPVESWSTWSPT